MGNRENNKLETSWTILSIHVNGIVDGILRKPSVLTKLSEQGESTGGRVGKEEELIEELEEG
jgi:hypothetical protein